MGVDSKANGLTYFSCVCRKYWRQGQKRSAELGQIINFDSFSLLFEPLRAPADSKVFFEKYAILCNSLNQKERRKSQCSKSQEKSHFRCKYFGKKTLEFSHQNHWFLKLWNFDQKWDLLISFTHCGYWEQTNSLLPKCWREESLKIAHTHTHN